MPDILQIVSEFRNEADIDTVNLPLIASAVKHRLGFQSQEDIRHCSLEVVKALGARGVHLFDPTQEHWGGANCEFWPGTVDDHLQRIDAEWTAMGRTPDLGEPICWFALGPIATTG